MLYLEYIVLALLVVYLSVRLSFYVDCLDKKTKLSGAFIGGVLLAAVTSLPELFTSLTAVLALRQPALVAGNVLGSNLFNLCIPAGILLFTSRAFRHAKLSASHRKTLLLALLMYALVAAAGFYGREWQLLFLKINPVTLAIVFVYAFNVIGMKEEAGSEEDEAVVSLSVAQLSVRFLLFSIALVAVSILLTQVSDQLAGELQLGATVAGAIFLGIATSLPELSASINLVRLGNFNASFGNIVGSNLFNFLILCFADVLYTGGGIYAWGTEGKNLLLFGAVSMGLTIVILCLQRHRLAVIAGSVLVLLSYIGSIFFSI